MDATDKRKRGRFMDVVKEDAQRVGVTDRVMAGVFVERTQMQTRERKTEV